MQKRRRRAGQIVGHSRNPLAKRQRHQRRRSGYRRSSISAVSLNSLSCLLVREGRSQARARPARAPLPDRLAKRASRRRRSADFSDSSNSTLMTAAARAHAQPTRARATERLLAARVERIPQARPRRTVGAGVAPEFPPMRNAELIGNGARRPTARRVSRLANCESAPTGGSDLLWLGDEHVGPLVVPRVTPTQPSAGSDARCSSQSGASSLDRYGYSSCRRSKREALGGICLPPVRHWSGELCTHPVDDCWHGRPLTHVAAVKHAGRLGVAVVEAEVEVVDRVLLIIAAVD